MNMLNTLHRCSPGRLDPHGSRLPAAAAGQAPLHDGRVAAF